MAVKLDIQHLRNLVLTATAFRRELSQIQDAASALADALQLVRLCFSFMAHSARGVGA